MNYRDDVLEGLKDVKEEDLTLQDVAQLRWAEAIKQMCDNIITTMINPRRITNNVLVQLVGTAILVTKDIPGVTTQFSKFKMASHSEALYIYKELQKLHSDCSTPDEQNPHNLRIKSYE